MGRRASTEQPNLPRRSSTSFEFRQVKKAITEEQAQPSPPTKKPTVLKDLDFTRKLHVGPENRAKVLNQLTRDCKVNSFPLLLTPPFPPLSSFFFPSLLPSSSSSSSLTLSSFSSFFLIQIVFVATPIDGLQSVDWHSAHGRYTYTQFHS